MITTLHSDTSLETSHHFLSQSTGYQVSRVQTEYMVSKVLGHIASHYPVNLLFNRLAVKPVQLGL